MEKSLLAPILRRPQGQSPSLIAIRWAFGRAFCVYSEKGKETDTAVRIHTSQNLHALVIRLVVERNNLRGIATGDRQLEKYAHNWTQVLPDCVAISI